MTSGNNGQFRSMTGFRLNHRGYGYSLPAASRPCLDCPFRTDIEPYVPRELLEQILALPESVAFNCHYPEAQQCAGYALFRNQSTDPLIYHSTAELLAAPMLRLSR